MGELSGGQGTGIDSKGDRISNSLETWRLGHSTDEKNLKQLARSRVASPLGPYWTLCVQALVCTLCMCICVCAHVGVVVHVHVCAPEGRASVGGCAARRALLTILWFADSCLSGLCVFPPSVGYSRALSNAHTTPQPQPVFLFSQRAARLTEPF